MWQHDDADCKISSFELAECKAMMTVGTYEAKTQLSRLLARVAKGERIMITRRGKPAALLVSNPAHENKDVEQIIEEMRELRRGNVLGDLSIRDLIEQGRRY